MVHIQEPVQYFEKKTVSFLQNYLVFFLFGVVYFYLYFIFFIKLNFPYYTNHMPSIFKTNVVGRYLPLILCTALFYLLIKKENINYTYANILFYFGYLLSAVYCWKLSTVFLPLDRASRAYGEYWWRIVPLPESYKPSLHKILYEIENVPIIGTMINILIGIGVCLLVAFLLGKIPNILSKPLNVKKANPVSHVLWFHFIVSSPYFIWASLDIRGDNPMEIVKAYHDFCEENTGHLRK